MGFIFLLLSDFNIALFLLMYAFCLLWCCFSLIFVIIYSINSIFNKRFLKILFPLSSLVYSYFLSECLNSGFDFVIFSVLCLLLLLLNFLYTYLYLKSFKIIKSEKEAIDEVSEKEAIDEINENETTNDCEIIKESSFSNKKVILVLLFNIIFFFFIPIGVNSFIYFMVN